MKNESGHRLSVNDDRKPQSYIDMKNELPMAVDAINDALRSNLDVYVHCAAGRYRSPTVIVAYLVKYTEMSLQEAITYVQKCKRDAFFFEHHFMEALVDFATEYANAL
jgi:atypical dual specificity phosphatase